MDNTIPDDVIRVSYDHGGYTIAVQNVMRGYDRCHQLALLLLLSDVIHLSGQIGIWCHSHPDTMSLHSHHVGDRCV